MKMANIKIFFRSIGYIKRVTFQLFYIRSFFFCCFRTYTPVQILRHMCGYWCIWHRLYIKSGDRPPDKELRRRHFQFITTNNNKEPLVFFISTCFFFFLILCVYVSFFRINNDK